MICSNLYFLFPTSAKISINEIYSHFVIQATIMTFLRISYDVYLLPNIFPLQAKMKYPFQKNKIKEVPFIPFNEISYFVAERSFFLIDL